MNVAANCSRENLSLVLTSDANRRLSALDRELVEQRLRAYWGLRGRGETESIASFLAEDCAYCGTTWVGGIVPVRRQGREGVLEFARHLRSIVEHLGTTFLDLVIDGDQAVASRKLKLRAQGTGRIGEVTVCSYVRFRDGQMAEIVELTDDESLTRLLHD